MRSLVIVQDDLILALNKPAGLSSQGGRGQANTLDELLFAFRRSNGNRPRLAHRLDRDTSGVILAAKTKPAAAALGRAWAERRVAKTYLALLPPGGAATGVVDAPLRRAEPVEGDHPRGLELPGAQGAPGTAAAGRRALRRGADRGRGGRSAADAARLLAGLPASGGWGAPGGGRPARRLRRGGARGGRRSRRRPGG